DLFGRRHGCFEPIGEELQVCVDDGNPARCVALDDLFEARIISGARPPVFCTRERMDPRLKTHNIPAKTIYQSLNQNISSRPCRFPCFESQNTPTKSDFLCYKINLVLGSAVVSRVLASGGYL
ncbi:MAG: hypothetical protein ABSC14_07660, partial [Desulfomonilia bacterium]